MIRAANLDDLPALADMGERFFAATSWADIFEYRPEDLAASLANLMELPNFICLVADEGGLVGVAAGITCPVYFNHSHISGEEMFWWVDDHKASQGIGARLLVALEQEARARGCASWQMKSIDRLNGARMAKLYERRGYVASEHSFIKRF